MRLPMSVRWSAAGHPYLVLSSAMDQAPFIFAACIYGGAHSGISSATAEVPAQAVLDLLRRGIGMLIEKSLGGDNKARRAEAALLRIVVNERLLDGMKMAGLAETFDGGDLRA